LKRGCSCALLKKVQGNCGSKGTDEKGGAQQEDVPWSFIFWFWFNYDRRIS